MAARPPADLWTPAKVRGLVDLHDEAMDAQKEQMGLTDAIYRTEFWEWWAGYGKRSKRFEWKWNGTEIEVNRLWKEVSIYTAALYQRANRVVCSPSLMGDGDARTIALVLNRWNQRRESQRRTQSAVAMTLLLGWCGFKVGYDTGRGNPIDRTWMRVTAPWETMLDRDVTDLADERYRGHVFYAPKQVIEQKYGVELVGAPRRDFLEYDSTRPASEKDITRGQGGGADTRDEYVRVVEFVNLVDPVIGRGGDVYKGRFEVHILDQPGEISKKPVVLSPLPFAEAGGRNLPNPEPLIFAHETGYPLRPLAPVKRLLPQCVERNQYRTKAADMTRRDARKVATRRGVLKDDEKNKLLSGVDMETVEFDGTEPLTQQIHVIPHAPISPAFEGYMRLVEADYQQVSGTSPAARGEVTKATAFEVQQVQLFTESDLGFHGLLLYEVLARVARLAQRAVIGAMRDAGDSEGGNDRPGLARAPVGAVDVDPPLSPENQAVSEMAADAAGSAQPATDVAPPVGQAKVGSGRVVLAEQTFQMLDRSEPVTVTIAALDADVEISFVEGARTPLTDQAMLEFLTGQGLALYFQLFEKAMGEDPMSVLAQAAMRHIAERVELPRDMHFEELAAEWKRRQAAQPAAPAPKAPPPASVAAQAAPPEPAAPEPGPAPAEGGAAVVMRQLRAAFAGLQQAAEGEPMMAQALRGAGLAVLSAIRAVESGDIDTMAASVQEAVEALSSLPPAVGERPGIPEARAALEPILVAVARETLPPVDNGAVVAEPNEMQ